METPKIARYDRPKRSRKRRKQPELKCGRIVTILPKFKRPWLLDRLKEPEGKPSPNYKAFFEKTGIGRPDPSE